VRYSANPIPISSPSRSPMRNDCLTTDKSYLPTLHPRGFGVLTPQTVGQHAESDGGGAALPWRAMSGTILTNGLLLT
jgi:hypothetical protein